MQVILHNIRSIYNVASIFRTSDGLGVEKLHLSGYTPAPTDRFGRSRDKFQKVALGAEDSVSWESVEDIKSHIKDLQKQEVVVLACEPTKEAVDYHSVSTAGDTCLVFGNEPDGLPEEITDLCDQVIAIPMQGDKTSLNVSVAFGIITAHMMKSKN